ncbi:RHS repeat-associated core domain-containing protein [Dysgonomonas sp. 521]|nr:RHS repeat-associated core domain-containing protein [Dysgonomonas sp. 521]
MNDHLGNNRVVANASGTLVQKNHYYPFGSVFASTTGAEKQPYKYNGKELDAMHGLNLYDYSARYMDSQIGRFTSVDPLAEKYYSWSPYSYVLNNPLRNIDPFGMDVWTTNDPEEIARALRHLQSVASNETSDPFDYGGWNRMTDDEYKEHNKANSLSFNDDSFDFNINLDDYQGSFKVGMRSKETNYAYITSTNLDALFAPDGEYDESYNLSATDLVGPSMILLGQPIKALKPIGALGSKPGSSIASYTLSKAIPVRFTQVLGKHTGTKVATTLGTNTIGRALGRGIPYAGWFLTSWSIGRELGTRYGGDAWVRSYRQNQRLNSYKPLVGAPK